jgi:hypothetical protein
MKPHDKLKNLLQPRVLLQVLKDTKKYYCHAIQCLISHLNSFVMAYNVAKIIYFT